MDQRTSARRRHTVARLWSDASRWPERARALGAIVVATVLIACGGAPAGSSVPPSSSLATSAAAAHIARASHRWLAGDLDHAIRELAAAGNEPHALAMLAQAYALTGKSAEARSVATRALAAVAPHPRPVPQVMPDVSGVAYVVVSPDGALVAFGDWTPIQGGPLPNTVWSTLTGRELYTTPGGRMVFGATATGEMMLVVVQDEVVRVLDARTGALRWTRPIGRTGDLAIDRRGTLTTQTYDATLAQWNLATGAPLGEIKTDAKLGGLAMADDGRTALAGETLYDLTAGPTKLAVLPSATFGSGLVDLRLSPDGQTIAVSRRDGSVQLYGRDGAPRARLEHAGSQAAFLDDGTLVASDGARLTRWNVTDGTSLADIALPPELRAIANDRIALGAGGHVVVRRGDALVMLQIKTAAPTIIARFGHALRGRALAWSADGGALEIGVADDRRIRWSVRDGARLVAAPASATAPATKPRLPALETSGRRVFMRDAGGHVLRLFEAGEPITSAALAGGRLVGASASGKLYLWNAETGEGLGDLAPGPTVTAVAVRPDGHTFAVARMSGDIELWDLASRTRLLELVVWSDGWLVRTPGGRFDGRFDALGWRAGELALPGDAMAPAVEPGLAAAVLGHPPSPVPGAITPPAALAIRACIPPDTSREALRATLDGDILTYCVGDANGTGDPYCFTADLETQAIAPAATPLELVAPRHYEDSVAAFSLVRGERSLDVCAAAGGCRTLPISLRDDEDGNGDEAVVSEDGEIVAIRRRRGTAVETWDLGRARRIARFTVRFLGRASDGGSRALDFLGHDVLTVFTPCAGPCSRALIYSPRGVPLGEFATEQSSASPERFHDDVWVLSDLNGGFAVQDAATGKVLALHLQRGTQELAISPDRVAALQGGDAGGTVLVLDRQAHLVATLPPPLCSN